MKIDIKEYITLPYRNDYHDDEIVHVKYSNVKKNCRSKRKGQNSFKKKNVKVEERDKNDFKQKKTFIISLPSLCITEERTQSYGL